jgi:hypothetical protein
LWDRAFLFIRDAKRKAKGDQKNELPGFEPESFGDVIEINQNQK